MHAMLNKQATGETTERDLIVVEESVVYEIKASSAVLHVSVKGSSYVADNMALKKAKEVSTLVDALKELGVPEEEIRLKNVVAETQSGMISKTSSAKYNLTVKVRDLEKLSEALSIVTSAKSCELHFLDWKFKEDRQKKLEYLGKVFAAARETGECIAKSLGVSISGVHNSTFEETALGDNEAYFGWGRGAVGLASKQNVSPDYESMSRSRGAAPQLPVGQWQRQAIRARVSFQIESGSGNNLD